MKSKYPISLLLLFVFVFSLTFGFSGTGTAGLPGIGDHPFTKKCWCCDAPNNGLGVWVGTGSNLHCSCMGCGVAGGENPFNCPLDCGGAE